MTAESEFARLVDIMRQLRRSCPWDREQTHESLRPYLLEESYEVLHALDEGSPDALREELGDLMLQIVFHAEIAGESGEFDIDDVLRTINEKLVRRHPHVFGDTPADDAEAVLRNWVRIKRDEKDRTSVLDGIPAELPSLLKAARTLSRARQAGVDPLGARDVFSVAAASLGRLRSAGDRVDRPATEKALGMLFLALAELADRADVNAEDALRTTLKRFADALRREEARLDERGRSLADLTGPEREALAGRLLAEDEED